MGFVKDQEAVRSFAQLLKRVEHGEEFTITRKGKPLAKVVPVESGNKRSLGFLDLDVPDDFFEPMSEEDLALWE